MQVGALALLALCQQNDMYSFVNARFTKDHFINEVERDIWSVVNHHVEQHNLLPSVTTIQEAMADTTLPKVSEPAEVYLKQVEERHTQRTLKKGIKDLADTLAEKGHEATIIEMEKMLGGILMARQRQRMELFSPDGLEDMRQYLAHKKLGAIQPGLSLGWPTFDLMSEGLLPGDVVSYVGRPGTGKSWMLLYSAHHAWWKQQKNVLVLSMEMSLQSVRTRLSALHTKVPIKYLKSGEMSDYGMKQFRQMAGQAKKHPSKLWVVDGNLSSTPTQIYALANNLKPDIVLIDGAYLLKNPNPRLSRFERVAENIEEIKRLTSITKVPTVCTFQFNRQAATKKKKGEDKDATGLEHIGYSDAIGQISSVVLGLFEPDLQEVASQRELVVLKGRDGQTGGYPVHWDFHGMDFSEVGEEEVTAFV